jgi:hypothetical protein
MKTADYDLAMIAPACRLIVGAKDGIAGTTG